MERTMFHRGILLFVFVLIAGCAAVPRDACGPGTQAALCDVLYFGTARQNGSVTEAQWRQFTDEVVTPRFRDGFTWWAASGQWRETDGKITREDSYVIEIIHPDDPAMDNAFDDIICEYKKRFDQRSVLRVRFRACISF